jgi:hypothetical protein
MARSTTDEEIGRLRIEGIPDDQLIWTTHFFSHFFSSYEERNAFSGDLIEAGFDNVDAVEELEGDQYWHHYTLTLHQASEVALRGADEAAARISERHGVRYNGWQVCRVGNDDDAPLRPLDPSLRPPATSV